MESAKNRTDIRFVKIAKVVYVRKEDILAYLKEMTACKADEVGHDASLRLNEAARLLGGIGA